MWHKHNVLICDMQVHIMQCEPGKLFQTMHEWRTLFFSFLFCCCIQKCLFNVFYTITSVVLSFALYMHKLNISRSEQNFFMETGETIVNNFWWLVVQGNSCWHHVLQYLNKTRIYPLYSCALFAWWSNLLFCGIECDGCLHILGCCGRAEEKPHKRFIHIITC